MMSLGWKWPVNLWAVTEAARTNYGVCRRTEIVRDILRQASADKAKSPYPAAAPAVNLDSDSAAGS